MISFVIDIIPSLKLRIRLPMTRLASHNSLLMYRQRQLSDGSGVTSPTDASDDELQVINDVESDVDEAVPRKRQKTRTGSNARITFSNVLAKSQNNNSSIVDGGSKKHKLPSLQNFATPTISAVDSKDACVTRVAISNTRPSPTMSISSCAQTDSIIVYGESRKHRLPSLQNFATPTALEVDSVDTCVARGAISNTEPSPTTSISSCVQINSSPTTIIRITPALSQNAPVKEGKEDKPTSTHSRKRVNGLSRLLVSRPLAMSSPTLTSDSLNSGVLKDREEPPRKTRRPTLKSTNWPYGTKLKKSQGRIADQDELELWTNADVADIGFKKPDELLLLDKVEEESTKKNVSHILTCLMEMEAKSSSENVARNEGVITNCVQTQVATPESVEEKMTPKALEWTKIDKNIQAVDGLEGHEDEEMRDDVSSLQVPLQQLECWSTTLRSLLKGKKKFQHQVRCDPFSFSKFSNFLNPPSGLDRPQKYPSRDLQQASKHFRHFLSCSGSLQSDTARNP